MAEYKRDIESGDVEVQGVPGVGNKPMEIPNLPKALTFEEKKYLLAVERGDMANVKRMLQRAHRKQYININCVDSLGRGALTLAIDGENLEMVELLVVLGVETKDALLQAINAEFVEAVELLLEHEELIHKDGQSYSWQKVDPNTAMFTPDMTPLVLAAHKNNYEIIKILLDRGATLPMPHDIKCGCEECLRESDEDSLRHSLSRVNEYKALASPSLIALSSSDPLLTAFQLSWEMRNLAFAEPESKSEYLELRRQCQKFAVDLLHQSRSSQELAIILNHDPDDPPYEHGEHMKLARLELAIDYKQKKFVAHPNIQQLLAAIWYEGVPGFRRKSGIKKFLIIMRVAILFPFYCMLYMIAPNCSTGKLMRKPFMKFLVHASSYLFFLLILILVSQRAEVRAIQLFGTEHMIKELDKELMKQRGNGPTYLEIVVVFYVLGFILEETQEMFIEGLRSYLRNMWNFIDFTRNSLYCAVAVLRVAAYIQQTNEIDKDPSTKFIPREHWDAFDPQLIAEGLFAAANVFSALKLVHMFSINPHLGPLQISLGRMVIDIVKFFFIYSLVLFAFACGLNQLLWYFAELEKRKCYVLPGGLPDWDNASDSCMKWRSFGNVFEASQSLFWASFGLVGLESFELAGIKSYTRFWGLLMFGSYSVINVIVLLNLLIAMMSNSYAMIVEHSDVEWKFARTKLWMSYFEESATLPPPFNIWPTPKLFLKMLGLRKKDKLRKMNSQKKAEKDRDVRYTGVMRALVWRYVSAMHRKCDEEPVTEDDINEVKGDISSMRYELLEVFERNGMDVSFTDRKEKMVLGKRMKIWERRLMKDFHVAPVALDEEDEEHDELAPPPEGENSLARFRRVAKMAAATSSSAKWGELVKGVCISSQIGRSRKRESFKQQQNLQRAITEARKIAMRSPVQENSRSTSPVEMPASPGHTLLELLKGMREDVAEASSSDSKQPWRPPGAGTGQTLTVQKLKGCKSFQCPSDRRSFSTVSDESAKTPPSKLPQQLNFPTIASTNATPMASPLISPATSPIRMSSTEVEKSKEQKSSEPAPAKAFVDQTEPKEEPSALAAVSRDSPPRVIKRKAPPPMATRPQGAIPPPPPPLRINVLPQVEVTPVTPKGKAELVSPAPPPLAMRPRTPTPPLRAVTPEAVESVHIPIEPTTLPMVQLTESQPSAISVVPTVQMRPITPPLQLTTSVQTSRPVTPPVSTPQVVPLKQEDDHNSAIVPSLHLDCSSSTEQLIPSSPGLNTRPVTDVKTIKRQPKTGWL